MGRIEDLSDYLTAYMNEFWRVLVHSVLQGGRPGVVTPPRLRRWQDRATDVAALFVRNYGGEFVHISGLPLTPPQTLCPWLNTHKSYFGAQQTCMLIVARDSSIVSCRAVRPGHQVLILPRPTWMFLLITEIGGRVDRRGGNRARFWTLARMVL